MAFRNPNNMDSNMTGMGGGGGGLGIGGGGLGSAGGMGSSGIGNIGGSGGMGGGSIGSGGGMGGGVIGNLGGAGVMGGGGGIGNIGSAGGMGGGGIGNIGSSSGMGGSIIGSGGGGIGSGGMGSIGGSGGMGGGGIGSIGGSGGMGGGGIGNIGGMGVGNIGGIGGGGGGMGGSTLGTGGGLGGSSGIIGGGQGIGSGAVAGQYGLGRKAVSELSPGTRKNLGMVGMPPQQGQIQLPQQPQSQQQQQQLSKPRKSGFFGEEDDSETSMYFQQGSMFQPNKEMMSSQSPSQLSAFGSNFYSQGLGNFSMQQRGGVSGAPPQFQRNNTGHVTPTSMNFSIGLQQQPQPSPNRGIISAIGGQRSILNQNKGAQQGMSNIQNRSIASGLPSSSAPLTSVGNSFGNSFSFGAGGRPNNDSSLLDLSEFPTLGNRSNLPSNPVPATRNYASYVLKDTNRHFGMFDYKHQVGLVSKPVQEQAPEFQIQQEDFPALPGAQNPPTPGSGESSRKTPTLSSTGSYEQAVTKDGAKFPGDKGSAQKRGIQTHPDGMISNIPLGMVNDQFGIVGLLTFIRAAENDPNLVALAPGIDLTTLGLNLNSPENLYSTFQSPWADSPCRPQDIDFHVPAEYLTNIFIRDKLAPIKLNRYGEDLLFFLYYMNGGDVLQLAAATELYNRDWRYHKEERVWITRAPGVEPIVKTNTYERGTYYFFDAQNWRKVAKEFHLEYDKLEEKPTLPLTLHHNPNQPIAAH